jgi:hypothetical protein
VFFQWLEYHMLSSDEFIAILRPYLEGIGA